MLRFIVRVLINALALWVAAWLLPGIEVGSEAAAEVSTNETVASVLSYLFVGLVFGIVNALVRPVVSLLSLPLTILTLGLFTIIINAGMLMLTSWLTSFTLIGFVVDDFFWTAILGAIIISLVSLVAGSITGTRR
ncbi:phage holin family protein [Arthrobacter sp. EH-1B-1]|uniref:Phage holin family protein n=1 Tax=Arthrobacter vasquezii TaxID=2977629 RepID=A0ABT6CWU6_9MICC|nr:phage holin family protein [Arthrobacter vasquezii]MDF9278531.1 phage holin family protein [Arthrobacter vasquezii]